MSLLDEAKAETKTTGVKAGIDRLIDHLIEQGAMDAADEVVELLKAEVVGHEAAARVLTNHYAEQAGRRVTALMVYRWRLNNPDLASTTTAEWLTQR